MFCLQKSCVTEKYTKENLWVLHRTLRKEEKQGDKAHKIEDTGQWGCAGRGRVGPRSVLYGSSVGHVPVLQLGVQFTGIHSIIMLCKSHTYFPVDLSNITFKKMFSGHVTVFHPKAASLATPPRL